MIEQCKKCIFYNSLNCPYNYEIASTQEDCDEFVENICEKCSSDENAKIFTGERQ